MRIAAALVFLSLIAASPAERTPDAAAAAFLDSFKAMDQPRFDRFFAEDVTMFFPSGSFPKGRVDGRVAVLAAFHTFFGVVKSKGRTSLNISPLDQRIQRHGDIAVLTFRLDGVDEVGRRTIVLRRDGADWRIIHFHASFIDK